MTTIGQLVASLFAKYERQFHDEKLAAVATQVALDELFARTQTPTAQSRMRGRAARTRDVPQQTL